MEVGPQRDLHGQNNLYYYTINSLNVTYGTASPTRFYDGELSFRQATTNLDLSREYDVGLSAPIKTAVGAEFRNDTYVIKQGDVSSWANGGFLVLDGPAAGTVPAFGAQGFPGFRPTDETNTNRNNIAGYIDVENQLTKNLSTSTSQCARKNTQRCRLDEHREDRGALPHQQLAERPRLLQRRLPRPAAPAGILHHHLVGDPDGERRDRSL